jgi:hypothetical protein
MDTNTPAPVPYSLEHLSDDDLHLGTRRLIGRSNQLLAGLLAHLAEVEARGIHRERACASLCSYCIYELRMSEDEASRRARASKIAREFPILFEQVAAGEIHLTGILLLGPHLTQDNHRDVLARAKHRTKSEIERLVRRLNPLPDVQALVEPLGPPPRAVIANPTWSQRVEAHSPEVRELEPGDRPRDWIDDSAADDSEAVDLAAAQTDTELAPSAPLEPQRYKVQFTATQEYVDLLEQARGLLAHAVPSRSIEGGASARNARARSPAREEATGATKERGSRAVENPKGPEGPTAPGDSEDPRQRGPKTAQLRAGAGGRFRAQSVGRCGSETPHAAPTSMRAVSAAAKLGVSSSITLTLMHAVDRPRSKTFACVPPTQCAHRRVRVRPRIHGLQDWRELRSSVATESPPISAPGVVAQGCHVQRRASDPVPTSQCGYSLSLSRPARRRSRVNNRG